LNTTNRERSAARYADSNPLLGLVYLNPWIEGNRPVKAALQGGF
jgi:hypothetical protein